MTVHRMRDMIGDEDVTDEATRAIVLRVADAQFRLEHDIGRIAGELGNLTSEMRKLRLVASIPPPPPIRAEAASGLDLNAFAAKAVDAAKEGDRRDDTSAEEQVQRVVAEEYDRRAKAQALRDERSELEHLRADIAAKAKARRDQWRFGAKLVAGCVSADGAIRIVQWLASLHHG